MLPPAVSYTDFCKRGCFVLLDPGRVALSSGESWTTLVSAARGKLLARPLLRCQHALESVLLPGSLGGLRFLPAQLSTKASSTMSDWTIALRGLEDNLSAICRRNGRTLVFDPPILCPVRVSVAGPRAARLRCMLGSFLQASYTTAIRAMVKELQVAAKRLFLYEHCTDEVFASRRYYSRHIIVSLPMDSWSAWLAVLGDGPSAELMGDLAGQVPQRDPGRVAAARLCVYLGAIAERLAGEINHVPTSVS